MIPAPPPTDELVRRGAPVELRDGSCVRVRQIRGSDEELLRRGFNRLSPKSRYRRFLTSVPELTEEMLRYLTDIDHHTHEALVAVDGEEGVGVARFVRSKERDDMAEVAVTVIDDWQGRGLGTVLLDTLSARARAEGITSFTAWMLAANDDMMDLFRRLGRVRIIDREGGVVEIEVAIPMVGVAPALRELLRIAARSDAAVPLPARRASRGLGRGVTTDS